VSELEFCGHLIGEGKIRLLISKVKVIQNWPFLTNIYDVRVFISFINYYRRYIKGFSQIVTPLYDLIKKGDAEVRKKKYRPIQWNVIYQAAF
jgi:hypothetical protein